MSLVRSGAIVVDLDKVYESKKTNTQIYDLLVEILKVSRRKARKIWSDYTYSKEYLLKGGRA